MVYVESISEEHDKPKTRFLALLSQCKHEHYADEDRSLLLQAFYFADKYHHDQKRASGVPYIFHVISVAEILVNLKMDVASIAAALLHDVIEDTDATYEELEEEFGQEIAHLVNSVTKMNVFTLMPEKVENSGTEKVHAKQQDVRMENLRNLLLAMAQDVRVVMIKLADRLHNMRTLNFLSRERQIVIARETADVYAPLANRLGIWQLKWELEDLAFRYQEPDKYKQIASHLDQRKVDRDQYIKEVLALIRGELENNHIHAQVSGRSKHIYSIWKKMQRKDLGFHQLYDLRAIRIIVDNVRDCYHVLGIIHSLWKHIPKEFDDYIATPKENNYQSIHTAVIGPQGRTLEVQIRTQDMHQHAEYGVAAHWRYKENREQNAHYEEKIAWLRQLFDWQNEEQNAGDFIDRFKSEVFQDRVYIFTPNGELIELPMGATVLDFAFYVHTEVGASCVGCKVNDHIVPLTYELQNGECVEVLTKKNRIPSRDWLNPNLGYLKTARARSKVRAWFKRQDLEHNMREGKSILEREIQRLGVNNISIDELVHRFHLKKQAELYTNIGRGDISSTQIARTFERMGLMPDKTHLTKPEQQLFHFSHEQKHQPNSGEVNILGVDNLLTQVAQCCSPVPGDEIVGYITKSRGISIHREDCKNIIHLEGEDAQRLIDVQWNVKPHKQYTVSVEVVALDRQGLLRDVTILLANAEINLMCVNSYTNPRDLTAKLRLKIEINGIEQLSQAVNKLLQVPNVFEAYRVED